MHKWQSISKTLWLSFSFGRLVSILHTVSVSSSQSWSFLTFWFVPSPSHPPLLFNSLLTDLTCTKPWVFIAHRSSCLHFLESLPLFAPSPISPSVPPLLSYTFPSLHLPASPPSICVKLFQCAIKAQCARVLSSLCQKQRDMGNKGPTVVCHK